MQTEQVDAQKYGPIGHCIYCGSLGGAKGLSDEHIVPFSLGGRAELLKASCSECAKETSRLERYLARCIFWELRVHTGAPTRRQFPDELPVNVVIGGATMQKIVPVTDHPFFLLMPVWMPAGILRGVQPSPAFESASAHLYYFIPDTLQKTLGLAAYETAEVRPQLTGGVDYSTFARALAKIAYCQAVANIGFREFRSLATTDIILGRYPNVPYFVGSRIGDPPPPLSDNVLHATDVSFLTIDRIKLIRVRLRLFASSGTGRNGTPLYEVIVGAPKEGLITRRGCAQPTLAQPNVLYVTLSI